MKKSEKKMPCGFKRTGKLKDHVAHYKVCEHPACTARLNEFYKFKILVRDGLRVSEGEVKR